MGNVDSKLILPKQILLIPSLATRSTLPETISSVVPYLSSFDQVFFSINGITSPSFEQEIIRAIPIRYLDRITLLKTSTLLRATDHCCLITNHLQLILSKDDLVMLLADDDCLSCDVDIQSYFDRLSLGHGGAIGVSRFALLQSDQPPLDLCQTVFPNEIITPLAFLLRDSTGHRFTSMSGMIVPFKVLNDVALFTKRMHGSGGRFEYMLMTHKSINILYSPNKAVALIRLHASQESRLLSSMDHLINETIYVLWIWMHQPKTRPWVEGSRVYGFTIKRVIYYIKLITKHAIQGAFVKSTGPA